MVKSRGFTLVELLVVFAIGALLVGLTPVAFERLKESTQYRDTLRNMLHDMRTARQQAVMHGQDTRFEINLAERTFGLAGRPAHALPRPLEMTTTVASIETQAHNQNTVSAIRFLPSGGSTGGSIDLKRPSGAGTRLKVDWMSGKVIQEPLPP